MRKLFVSLILSWVVSTAQGTPMPEETKQEFIKGGIQSCLVKQPEDPLSKYMTESQRREYCTCAITRASDFITNEDLVIFFQTKSNPHMISATEFASNDCLQMLLKKWRHTK